MKIEHPNRAVPMAVDYLRLCLGGQWSLSALDEAQAISGRADFDWDTARQCAWNEGVALMFYDVVRGLDRIPHAFEAELHTAYRESAVRNMTLMGERDRVIRELDDDSVTSILLKGAALIETVYRDIALRPMSDIDLLVQPRDVRTVVRRLARAGYATPGDLESRGDPPPEYENELAVGKPGNARYRFDVHWSLFAAPYYQHRVASDWFWASARPIAATVRGSQNVSIGGLHALALCLALAMVATARVSVSLVIAPVASEAI